MAMVWQKEKEHKKKDIRYLNACLNADLHDELDESCKSHGMPKVEAVEAALGTQGIHEHRRR